MRKLKMLADHQGARAGDVVAFQSDEEAVALVRAGKAEPYDEKAHGAPGDDGRHGNPSAVPDGDV